MSLAKERQRRSRAGSGMAKLLNEEEEDEFYATTYGGFKDEDDDNEYTYVSGVILQELLRFRGA
jgi:hypothetical protein